MRLLRPDLVDQHIDLKRRIRNLETRVQGTPASYAKRRLHPHPIAEHLCKASTVPWPFPFGEVAGNLWAREQQESRLEIHRLLRVLRERVEANDWIGNLGVVPLARSVPAPLLRPIQPAGAFISHGSSPLFASSNLILVQGSFAHRLVSPGEPKYRAQFYLGADGFYSGMEIFIGWDDEGAGSGLADTTGNNAPKFIPYPAGAFLSSVQDLYVYGNPALSPTLFGYGRGNTNFYDYPDANGGQTVTNYPEKRIEILLPDGEGDWGPQSRRYGDADGADEATDPLYLAGVPYYRAASGSSYATNPPTPRHTEAAVGVDTKYIAIPTDWIRSWGPVIEDFTSNTWPTGQGGAGTKPFTQATYAGVEAAYEAEMADPALSALAAWYSEANWTAKLPTTPYDHEWAGLGSGSNGAVEYVDRHGMIDLRGWARVDSLPAVPAIYAPSEELSFPVVTTLGVKRLLVTTLGQLLMATGQGLSNAHQVRLDGITWPSI